MDGIKKQVKQTAKAAAVKTAKQMAREPLEILKQVPTQVAGSERVEGEGKSSEASPDLEHKELSPEEKVKREQKARSLAAAYEAELADIRKAREEAKVAAKQEELVEAQEEEAKSVKPLEEPTSKPKRGLFSGVRTRLERMKRKGEIRMPPSG